VHRVASEMFLKKWGKLGVLLIPKTARGKKQHPKGVSNIYYGITSTKCIQGGSKICIS
jgi:hypothetical protein